MIKASVFFIGIGCLFLSESVGFKAFAADLRNSQQQNLRNNPTYINPNGYPVKQTPSPQDPAEKDVQELQRQNAQRQRTYQGLNQVNPMSTDFGSQGGNTPVLPEAFRKLMEHKTFKALIQVSMDRNFQKNLLAIMDTPARKTLLLSELGWVVFMLFFRSWRLSLCDVWREKLWTGTWTTLLMFFGVSIILPFIFLGDPYMKVVSAFLEAVL